MEILDGRGSPHEFTERWHDRLCMHFYYLDGRRIGVDDRYGWTYLPEGKVVGDKVLRENLDRAAFGKVIPVGGDEED